jgi:gluconolactonase
MPDPKFDVVAEGLLFPEGPIAMPDGSVLCVEILRGTLTRAWGDGKTEIVANIGGGPNGAAVGPDGSVYITNNGGFVWTRNSAGEPIVEFAGLPADYAGGRIERVNLATGRVDRIYDKVGGHGFKAPNDLVFDRSGGFWFTDIGRVYDRHRDLSGIYYALPDGSAIREVVYGAANYNGIGLAPDEKTLYVADSMTAKLYALPLSGPGQLAQELGRDPAPVPIGACMLGAHLDSLAVQENGDVCVGTIFRGGITTFSVHGLEPAHTPFPDSFVTNICFGGRDLRTAFITCSASGKLIRTQWPSAGLRLNFST